MPGKRIGRLAIAAFVWMMSWSVDALAQETPSLPSSAADEALVAYLRERAGASEQPTRYVAATTGQGTEAITLVYLTGPGWCGSGGCRLLVLRRSGDGFDSLGEISVAGPPIRVLGSVSNGRPDLAVQVRGGGILDSHEALVPFDGRRYAANPTVAPARRVENAPGVEVIGQENRGVPLEP